ncbi:ribonuclease P protein subunit [Candidatus Marsarchaeota archaeon]|nr:ribonuclease P protein subunit [Candidatus Marsarchaeota archaeon]MCL5099653.1 ribonuclease P protein subunit [Candidatus Marsarchaeota archaeon]
MPRGLNMHDTDSNPAILDNRNIVLHELIGLKVRVLKGPYAGKKGSLRGIVIGETKNTIVVETRHGDRTVPKLGSIFAFEVGAQRFVVEGREINFRPFERTEKALKFYKARRA